MKPSSTLWFASLKDGMRLSSILWLAYVPVKYSYCLCTSKIQLLIFWLCCVRQAGNPFILPKSDIFSIMEKCQHDPEVQFVTKHPVHILASVRSCMWTWKCSKTLVYKVHAVINHRHKFMVFPSLDITFLVSVFMLANMITVLTSLQSEQSCGSLIISY